MARVFSSLWSNNHRNSVNPCALRRSDDTDILHHVTTSWWPVGTPRDTWRTALIASCEDNRRVMLCQPHQARTILKSNECDDRPWRLEMDTRSVQMTLNKNWYGAPCSRRRSWIERAGRRNLTSAERSRSPLVQIGSWYFSFLDGAPNA